MIEVRLYQNNDLESVNNILRESFNITKNNFNYNNITEIVACLDNKVCGYLILTKVLNPIKNRYYYLVDYVCVSSNYRRLGIGKKLMDYATLLANKDNAMYLQLTCSTFRKDAHKLYKKCGYVKRDSDIFRRKLE